MDSESQKIRREILRSAARAKGDEGGTMADYKPPEGYTLVTLEERDYIQRSKRREERLTWAMGWLGPLLKYLLFAIAAMVIGWDKIVKLWLEVRGL